MYLHTSKRMNTCIYMPQHRRCICEWYNGQWCNVESEVRVQILLRSISNKYSCEMYKFIVTPPVVIDTQEGRVCSLVMSDRTNHTSKPFCYVSHNVIGIRKYRGKGRLDIKDNNPTNNPGISYHVTEIQTLITTLQSITMNESQLLFKLPYTENKKKKRFCL